MSSFFKIPDQAPADLHLFATTLEPQQNKHRLGTFNTVFDLTEGFLRFFISVT